jgi:CheY-like chemotaxis protein
VLKCIAIDDEELALELLEDNISKVPYLQLVATSGNPIEAINIIQQQHVDLVFLDIQMPGLTGLQLIQSLPNKPMFILGRLSCKACKSRPFYKSMQQGMGITPAKNQTCRNLKRSRTKLLFYQCRL